MHAELTRSADRGSRAAFEQAVIAHWNWWPPIAGRIFAHLLMADDSLMSAPELVSALGVSTGSISTMTRFLIFQGVVERVKKPGHRPDFYRPLIEPQAIVAGLVASLTRLAALAEMIPADLSTDAEERITTLCSFGTALAHRVEPLSKIKYVPVRSRQQTG